MNSVCMVVYQNYYRDSRIRRYAEGLVASGAVVHVLCLRDAEGLPTSQTKGVKVFTLPLRHATGSLSHYMLAFDAALVLFTVRLLALYLRYHYQVIHVHNMPDYLVLSALIPRAIGARVILDIHDPMPEFYASRYLQAHSKGTVRLLRLQERISVNIAHAVITANTRFQANLVSRGIPASKVTVINNVPDPAVFDRTLYRNGRQGDHPFTLIYAGTIAPRYGLDVAIGALPHLVGGIPGIKLVLIGGAQPQYLSELRRLAEKLGVAGSVQFRPPISVDQVPQQMAQADIGIYPALPDLHMEIATPSKVVEYAVMGLPIVASRLKVLSQLFGDKAIAFFEPGNPEQLAECVEVLYADPARRRELVENADAAYVCTHSWQAEQQTYFDLLQRLLDST